MVERTRRDFLFGAMAMTLHKADWTQTPRLDLAALRSRRDWQKAREQILTGMQLVMGQLPEPKKLSNEITTLSSVETFTFTQTKIKYIAEPGDLVDAYLLVPKALKRKAPAMLCLHQTIKIGKGEPIGLRESNLRTLKNWRNEAGVSSSRAILSGRKYV